MNTRPVKTKEYFAKLLNIPDDEIDYSEIPPTTAADWQDAEVLLPVPPEKSDAIGKRTTLASQAVAPRASEEGNTDPTKGSTGSPIRPWAWNLDEKQFVERAYESLREVDWISSLVQSVHSQGGIVPENSSFLWELKFAYELHSRGIAANYEYQAGVGNSTVDFRIIDTYEWLVELVEIGESIAAAEATKSDGKNFSRILRTLQSKQSDERKMLLVEKKILEKVIKDKKPVKFPQPSEGVYHIILVDLQKMFPFADDEMLEQIAYGPDGLKNSLGVMCCDQKKPILGLFEPSNPLRGAELFRKRIHFIGFYRGGDIAEDTTYAANPHLFSEQQDAQQVFHRYQISSLAHIDKLLLYRPKSIWLRGRPRGEDSW